MSTEVVGREMAVQTVVGFLQSLSDGPAVLLLDGEAGIGKTTLWRAALVRAVHEGYRVLSSQPASAEVGLTYVTLADLLSDIEESAFEHLPRAQRRAIELVLVRADAEATSTDGRAAGAALLNILEHLASRQPVLLAIDDLQWADVSSLRAIAFAVRRLSSPVGVLTTMRTDGPPPQQPWGLPEVDRVHRLSLEPFSTRALSGVLRERTGFSFPSPTLARIHHLSGGNPFYALELVRSLRQADATIDTAASAEATLVLPDTLTNLVESRIEKFDGDVRRCLLAAAAMGELTVRLVRAALGVDDTEAQRRVEIAEAQGILTIDGGRIRFTHPLLAAGVQRVAAPADLRAMHRRLAALEGIPTEERARHLALGAVQPDRETVAALDDAAACVRGRGAPAAAAELLELAVRLGADDPERRVRLSAYLYEAGDPARARLLLERAVKDVAPGPVRAEALLLLATVQLQGSYREAADCLARAALETADDLWLRVQISIEMLYVSVNLGRIAEAMELSTQVVDDAERLGNPDLLARALATSVMIRFLRGEGLDRQALQRALDLEQTDVRMPIMLRPTLISGLLHGWSGDLDHGRKLLLELRQRCIDRGEESDLMFGAFHIVIIECSRGNFADARLFAEDTWERAQQLGTDLPLAIAQATKAMVCAYAGEVDEARVAVRDALALFGRGGSVAVTVWPLVTLGFVELSVGDFDAAVAVLEPLTAAVPTMGYGEPTAAPFAPYAAEALIGVGRLADAAALVDRLEGDGGRLDRAWALALGGRCRSLLLAAEGDLDGAADAAQRALVEHARLSMPFERARTELILGQVQRRRRQKSAAGQAINAALQTFEDLGTPLWSARARDELERVHLRRVPGAQLTPAERRVATLAGTGMTNREVAKAMFIHPKTVEANLARVYRKLGIHSRAELGRWLSTSDDLPAPDSLPT